MSEEYLEHKSKFDFDEIVFEHRNKEYGAYDLRKSYRYILTKSFIIGTIIFLIIALFPLIILKIKQMNAPKKQVVDIKLLDVHEPDPIVEQPKEKEPPPPPPPPKKEEPKIEVIKNVVPQPTKVPKVETPPPPISEQLKTTTGLVDQKGVKAPAYTPPPAPPSTGKGAIAEVTPSKTEVYTAVDQEPSFGKGGIEGFRNRFQEDFDRDVMDGEDGVISTVVTFIVEIDGSVTQVKATGSNSDFNREAERTVRSIKTKWTPAKINGHPVRYRIRLPVKMQFES